MPDTAAEQQPVLGKSIDAVMSNIERQCTDKSSESTGGVYLFREITTKAQDKEHRAKYAANGVFDGMMLTLEEIGAYSVEKAKSRSPLAKDYEGVARAIEPLTVACRALADDRVPLVRNTLLEQRQAEAGDTVYAYKARNVSLEGELYMEVRVFIRPRRYEQSIAMRDQMLRRRVQIAETAQSRMRIDVIPADITKSAVSIRTDREDALRDYEITYDIEIGQGDVHLMDELDFSRSGASQIDPGQRHGHHFSSKLTAEEFGVTFTDILEASNQKFAQVASNTTNRPTS